MRKKGFKKLTLTRHIKGKGGSEPLIKLAGANGWQNDRSERDGKRHTLNGSEVVKSQEDPVLKRYFKKKDVFKMKLFLDIKNHSVGEEAVAVSTNDSRFEVLVGLCISATQRAIPTRVLFLASPNKQGRSNGRD